MLTIIFHLLVFLGVHCLLDKEEDLVRAFLLMRIYQYLFQNQVKELICMGFLFELLLFINQTSRLSFVPMFAIIFHLLVFWGVHCLLDKVEDLARAFLLMRIFQLLNQVKGLNNMEFWYLL